MPVNEEDVVNIMGGMPEGIRLNDHRRRLKNRQILFIEIIIFHLTTSDFYVEKIMDEL